jgi:hypothetical protein
MSNPVRDRSVFGLAVMTINVSAGKSMTRAHSPWERVRIKTASHPPQPLSGSSTALDPPDRSFLLPPELVLGFHFVEAEDNASQPDNVFPSSQDLLQRHLQPRSSLCLEEIAPL